MKSISSQFLGFVVPGVMWPIFLVPTTFFPCMNAGAGIEVRHLGERACPGEVGIVLESGAEDDHQLHAGADVALEGEAVGGGAAHPVFHVRRQSLRAQRRAAPRKTGPRVSDQRVAQLGEPALAERRLLTRGDDEHGSASIAPRPAREVGRLVQTICTRREGGRAIRMSANGTPDQDR